MATARFQKIEFRPGAFLTWAHDGLQKTWDPLEKLTLVHACTHMCVFLKRRIMVFIRFSKHSLQIKTMIFPARGVAILHPLMQRSVWETQVWSSQQRQQTLFYLTSRPLSLSVCIPIFASKFFVFLILPLKNPFFLNQGNTFVFPPRPWLFLILAVDNTPIFY